MGVSHNVAVADGCGVDVAVGMSVGVAVGVFVVTGVSASGWKGVAVAVHVTGGSAGDGADAAAGGTPQPPSHAGINAAIARS